MEKKVRYPIEAFALAMVLFSAEMKTAMLVGIALVFGDVLSCLIAEGTSAKGCCRGQIAQLGAFVMGGAVLLMLGEETVTAATALGVAALSAAMFRHSLDNKGVKEFNYGDILFADAIAYAALVLLAVVRELLGADSVFGFEVAAFGLAGQLFLRPMFAAIAAGCVTVALAHMLKTSGNKGSGLWVGVPVFAVCVLLGGSVRELIGAAVGAVIAALLAEQAAESHD